MDHHKLRSAVFEKTGIKIDTTDPVFALVALNEAVLEEMFQRHLNLLQASHGAAPPGTMGPGNSLHQAPAMADNWEQEDAVAALNASPAPESQVGNADIATTANFVPARSANSMAPSRPGAAPALDRRLLAFAAALGFAAALLVVAVQSLLAPGLNPEQKLQLQKAEKQRQALEQLDPKLKAQLPPALKQP